MRNQNSNSNNNNASSPSNPHRNHASPATHLPNSVRSINVQPAPYNNINTNIPQQQQHQQQPLPTMLASNPSSPTHGPSSATGSPKTVMNSGNRSFGTAHPHSHSSGTTSVNQSFSMNSPQQPPSFGGLPSALTSSSGNNVFASVGVGVNASNSNSNNNNFVSRNVGAVSSSSPLSSSAPSNNVSFGNAVHHQNNTNNMSNNTSFGFQTGNNIHPALHQHHSSQNTSANRTANASFATTAHHHHHHHHLQSNNSPNTSANHSHRPSMMMIMTNHTTNSSSYGDISSQAPTSAQRSFAGNPSFGGSGQQSAHHHHNAGGGSGSSPTSLSNTPANRSPQGTINNLPLQQIRRQEQQRNQQQQQQTGGSGSDTDHSHHFYRNNSGGSKQQQSAAAALRRNSHSSGDLNRTNNSNNNARYGGSSSSYPDFVDSSEEMGSKKSSGRSHQFHQKKQQRQKHQKQQQQQHDDNSVCCSTSSSCETCSSCCFRNCCCTRRVQTTSFASTLSRWANALFLLAVFSFILLGAMILIFSFRFTERSEVATNCLVNLNCSELPTSSSGAANSSNSFDVPDQMILQLDDMMWGQCLALVASGRSTTGAVVEVPSYLRFTPLSTDFFQIDSVKVKVSRDSSVSLKTYELVMNRSSSSSSSSVFSRSFPQRSATMKDALSSQIEQKINIDCSLQLSSSTASSSTIEQAITLLNRDGGMDSTSVLLSLRQTRIKKSTKEYSKSLSQVLIDPADGSCFSSTTSGGDDGSADCVNLEQHSSSLSSNRSALWIVVFVLQCLAFCLGLAAFCIARVQTQKNKRLFASTNRLVEEITASATIMSSNWGTYKYDQVSSNKKNKNKQQQKNKKNSNDNNDDNGGGGFLSRIFGSIVKSTQTQEENVDDNFIDEEKDIDLSEASIIETMIETAQGRSILIRKLKAKKNLETLLSFVPRAVRNPALRAICERDYEKQLHDDDIENEFGLGAGGFGHHHHHNHDDGYDDDDPILLPLPSSKHHPQHHHHRSTTNVVSKQQQQQQQQNAAALMSRKNTGMTNLTEGSFHGGSSSGMMMNQNSASNNNNIVSDFNLAGGNDSITNFASVTLTGNDSLAANNSMSNYPSFGGGNNNPPNSTTNKDHHSSFFGPMMKQSPNASPNFEHLNVAGSGGTNKTATNNNGGGGGNSNNSSQMHLLTANSTTERRSSSVAGYARAASRLKRSATPFLTSGGSNQHSNANNINNEPSSPGNSSNPFSNSSSPKDIQHAISNNNPNASPFSSRHGGSPTSGSLHNQQHQGSSGLLLTGSPTSSTLHHLHPHGQQQQQQHPHHHSFHNNPSSSLILHQQQQPEFTHVRLAPGSVMRRRRCSGLFCQLHFDASLPKSHLPAISELLDQFVYDVSNTAKQYSGVVVEWGFGQALIQWNGFTPYGLHETQACLCAMALAGHFQQYEENPKFKSNNNNSNQASSGRTNRSHSTYNAATMSGFGSSNINNAESSANNNNENTANFSICVNSGIMTVGLCGTVGNLSPFCIGDCVNQMRYGVELGRMINCRVIALHETIKTCNARIVTAPVDVVSFDNGVSKTVVHEVRNDAFFDQSHSGNPVTGGGASNNNNNHTQSLNSFSISKGQSAEEAAARPHYIKGFMYLTQSRYVDAFKSFTRSDEIYPFDYQIPRLLQICYVYGTIQNERRFKQRQEYRAMKEQMKQQAAANGEEYPPSSHLLMKNDSNNQFNSPGNESNLNNDPEEEDFELFTLQYVRLAPAWIFPEVDAQNLDTAMFNEQNNMETMLMMDQQQQQQQQDDANAMASKLTSVDSNSFSSNHTNYNSNSNTNPAVVASTQPYRESNNDNITSIEEQQEGGLGAPQTPTMQSHQQQQQKHVNRGKSPSSESTQNALDRRDSAPMIQLMITGENDEETGEGGGTTGDAGGVYEYKNVHHQQQQQQGTNNKIIANSKRDSGDYVDQFEESDRYGANINDDEIRRKLGEARSSTMTPSHFNKNKPNSSNSNINSYNNSSQQTPSPTNLQVASNNGSGTNFINQVTLLNNTTNSNANSKPNSHNNTRKNSFDDVNYHDEENDDDADVIYVDTPDSTSLEGPSNQNRHRNQNQNNQQQNSSNFSTIQSDVNSLKSPPHQQRSSVSANLSVTSLHPNHSGATLPPTPETTGQFVNSGVFNHSTTTTSASQQQQHNQQQQNGDGTSATAAEGGAMCDASGSLIALFDDEDDSSGDALPTTNHFLNNNNNNKRNSNNSDEMQRQNSNDVNNNQQQQTRNSVLSHSSSSNSNNNNNQNNNNNNNKLISLPDDGTTDQQQQQQQQRKPSFSASMLAAMLYSCDCDLGRFTDREGRLWTCGNAISGRGGGTEKEKQQQQQNKDDNDNYEDLSASARAVNHFSVHTGVSVTDGSLAELTVFHIPPELIEAKKREKEDKLKKENNNASSSTTITSASVLEELTDEARQAHSLRHSCLQSCISIATTQDQLHFILIKETCGGGTLANLLSQFGPLGITALRRFAQDIAKALQFYHNQRNAPHGALDTKNVLLSVDGFCKLTLTGMNTVFQTGSMGEEFLAPEIAAAGEGIAVLSSTTSNNRSFGNNNNSNNNTDALELTSSTSAATLLNSTSNNMNETATSVPPPSSVAGDVWSFGIVLCYMVSGHSPYEHTYEAIDDGTLSDDVPLRTRIATRVAKPVNPIRALEAAAVASTANSSISKLDFSSGDEAQEMLGRLIDQCLRSNPKRRITIQQILSDPFFII